MLYLIDDDKEVLDALKIHLSGAGFDVRTFESSEVAWQALKALKQEQLPELILCDLDMPGRSGLDLLEDLRSHPALQDLPFVFLSAHNSAEDIQKGLAYSADDYLTKPIKSQELLTRIQKTLQRRERLTKRIAHTAARDATHDFVQRMHLACHDIAGSLSNVYLLSSLINDDGQVLTEINDQSVKHNLKNQVELSIGMLRRYMRVLDDRARKGTAPPRELDLKALLKKALEPLEFMAHHKGISLIQRIPPGTLIWGVEDQWQSVMYNLVHNALKFTSSGGEVCVEAEGEDGLVLRVKDTGKGMTKKRQDQLFRTRLEPHADTTGKTGHGVGLMLCQQLVENMGGRIEVDSQPGKGTVFIIHARGHVSTSDANESHREEIEHLPTSVPSSPPLSA